MEIKQIKDSLMNISLQRKYSLFTLEDDIRKVNYKLSEKKVKLEFSRKPYCKEDKSRKYSKYTVVAVEQNSKEYKAIPVIEDANIYTTTLAVY